MSHDSPKATRSCAVKPVWPRQPVFAKRCCPAQLIGLWLCPEAQSFVYTWRAFSRTCGSDGMGELSAAGRVSSYNPQESHLGLASKMENTHIL